jgi:hypothetical protein
MTRIERNWAIHATITAALFAVPYKFWLTTPVLQNISIGNWRLLAISVAVGLGLGLSRMSVATPILSCGATLGLLVGGTIAVWTAPHDVAISVYCAFASHFKSFWREVLVLVATATLAALCSGYLRRHQPLLR